MNIVIWGDSITWGAYLPSRDSWANLLRSYLESKNSNMALYDLGIDGNTSVDVLSRFPVEAKARKPEVILFAIGTNDSGYRLSKDNPIVSISDYENNLNEMIEQARKHCDKIMFVGLVKGDDACTVPLKRSTTGKCYDKENIQKYNDCIKRICESKNVLFSDIFDSLNDDDFYDGLHPNFTGHIKIYLKVRETLSKLI